MSAATRVRFRDLDVVLSKDNFAVTLIGMILAFITGSFDITWFNLENIFGFPVAPTTLVWNMAILLIVLGYTKNLGSAILVSLATVMGMTNNFGSSSIGLFETYLGAILVTSILTGYLIARFSQIINWGLFFFVHTLVFVLFSMTLGHFARVEAPKYWDIGINLGIGGTFGGFEFELFGGPLPIADLIISILAVLSMFLLFLRMRSKDIYSSDSASKLSIVGFLFIILGFLISLIPAVLYTARINQSKLVELSTPLLLEPLFDLFTESSSASAIVSPGNVFFSAVISTVLFNMGIVLRMVAKKKDTLSWIEGGPDLILVGPSIFTMSFTIFGLKPVQDLAYPGGMFIAQELFPIYFAEIWTSFMWNALVAWFVLIILFRVKKTDQ